VTCDWLRLRYLAETARTATPDRALVLLQEGLALLSDADSGLAYRPPVWMSASGLSSTIACEVVDAAHQLAQLALAGDLPELSEWAITRGRWYVPASEILARDLMVTADSTGNLERVREVFADLESALERLGGNEPSAESYSLFQALLATNGSEVADGR
jgi:hypothetical protein